MSSNLKRLAAVAAVGAAAALAPVASANAASPTDHPPFHLRGFHLPSLAGFTFPTLPSFMPALPAFVPPPGSVVGPTIMTIGNGTVSNGATVTTTRDGVVPAATPSAP